MMLKKKVQMIKRKLEPRKAIADALVAPCAAAAVALASWRLATLRSSRALAQTKLPACATQSDELAFRRC